MKWISVEERTTEEMGECPILLTDGKSVTVGVFREQNGQWPWVVFDPGTNDDLNGWPDKNITHWMPLPDPPEEK